VLQEELALLAERKEQEEAQEEKGEGKDRRKKAI